MSGDGRSWRYRLILRAWNTCAMNLAKAVEGSLRDPQRITWGYIDPITKQFTPMNLIDATLSGVLRPRATRVERAIAGMLLLVDAANGIFDWEYDAADVVHGHYDVRFQADYVSGLSPALTFWQYWYVE